MFAITGKRGVGKTTFLTNLAQHFQADNYRIGGFFQQRVVNEVGETIRYKVVRWKTRESHPIATLGPEGKYCFSETAFQIASIWLQEDAPLSQCIIIDEIGKLESNGLGHASAFQELLANPLPSVVLVTLRKDTIEKLTPMFSIAEDRIWDLDVQPADLTGFQNWMKINEES